MRTNQTILMALRYLDENTTIEFLQGIPRYYLVCRNERTETIKFSVSKNVIDTLQRFKENLERIEGLAAEERKRVRKEALAAKRAATKEKSNGRPSKV